MKTIKVVFFLQKCFFYIIVVMLEVTSIPKTDGVVLTRALVIITVFFVGITFKTLGVVIVGKIGFEKRCLQGNLFILTKQIYFMLAYIFHIFSVIMLVYQFAEFNVVLAFSLFR